MPIPPRGVPGVHGLSVQYEIEPALPTTRSWDGDLESIQVVDSKVRRVDDLQASRRNPHLADLESQFSHLADVIQSIAALREDVTEWEQEVGAYVVVIHLSPEQPSALSEILSTWGHAIERTG